MTASTPLDGQLRTLNLKLGMIGAMDSRRTTAARAALHRVAAGQLLGHLQVILGGALGSPLHGVVGTAATALVAAAVAKLASMRRLS